MTAGVPAPSATSQAGARMLGPLVYDAAAAAVAFALAYNIASGQIWAVGALPDPAPLAPGALTYAVIATAMA